MNASTTVELQIRWIVIPVFEAAQPSPNFCFRIVALPVTDNLANNTNNDGSVNSNVTPGPFADWPATLAKLSHFHITFADSAGNALADPHGLLVQPFNAEFMDSPPILQDASAWGVLFPSTGGPADHAKSVAHHPTQLKYSQVDHPVPIASYPYRRVATGLRAVAIRHALRSLIPNSAALQPNIPPDLTDEIAQSPQQFGFFSSPQSDVSKSFLIIGTGLDVDLAGITWAGNRSRKHDNEASQPILTSKIILADLAPLTTPPDSYDPVLSTQEDQINRLAQIMNMSADKVAANYKMNVSRRTVRNQFRLDWSSVLDSSRDNNNEINTKLQLSLGNLSSRLYGPRAYSNTPLPRAHAADYLRLYSFHKRAGFFYNNPTSPETASAANTIGSAQQILDMVTHLQNYPRLLKKLGLVREVKITTDAKGNPVSNDALLSFLGGKSSIAGTVKANPVWQTGPESSSNCYTRFGITNTKNQGSETWAFRTADPSDSWIKQGYLNLQVEEKRYEIKNIDKHKDQIKDDVGKFEDASRRFHLENLDADHGGMSLSLLARTICELPPQRALSVLKNGALPFVPLTQDSLNPGTDKQSITFQYLSSNVSNIMNGAVTTESIAKTGFILHTNDVQRLNMVLQFANKNAGRIQNQKLVVPGLQLQLPGPENTVLTANAEIYISNGTASAVLWQLGQSATVPASSTSVPPAHRSNGLSLVWTGRDHDLANTITHDLTAKVSGSNPVFLDSADLLLGFVPYVSIIDQYDRTKSRPPNAPPFWVSLCQRYENYHKIFTDETKDAPAEMPLRITATKPLDTATPNKLQNNQQQVEERMLGEALFRWSGENLAQPKQSISVTAKDSDYDMQTGLEKNPQPQVVPVTTKPMLTRRLRYSRPLPTVGPLRDSRFLPYEFNSAQQLGYSMMRDRFCVSVMDRSGQFRDPNDNLDEDVPWLETPYLRYDPIPPPELLIDGGERGMSRRTTTLDEMIVGGNTFEQRCVVPKHVDQQTCETHGMLDSNHWQYRSFNAVEFSEDTLEFPLDSVTKLPIRKPGLSNSEINAPYFPDPMVCRVGWWITGLDQQFIDGKDAGGPILLYPMSTTWPESRAASFRLAETWRSEMSASGGTASEVREISLPAGWQATLYLCGLPDADHQHSPQGFAVMAEFHELMTLGTAHLSNNSKNAQGDTVINVLKAKTLDGYNPRLTPSRAITLVHAVPKPLRPPMFKNAVPKIELDGAKATLTGFIVTVDEKSTGRVDLHAEWQEFVDYQDSPKPPFLENHSIDLDGVALSQPLSSGTFDAHLKPITQIFTAPSPRRAARFRRINYIARAKSRFRDYYLSTRPESDFTIDSLPNQLLILNPVPPDPPNIRYHAPAFRWSTEETQKDFWGNPRKFQSFRRNAIRVYMERGFYTSGEGEKIGVVVPRRDYVFGSHDDYITRWGSDPTRRSPLLPWTSIGPLASNFVLWKDIASNVGRICDAQGENCKPNGLMPAFPFDLVLYEPTFDPTENLWYFDFGLDLAPGDPKTGWPATNPEDYGVFVKFVLVRYQEHSEKGACISSPIQLDFARLYPDRSVAVTRVKRAASKVRIEVFGVTEKPTDTLSYAFDLEISRPHDTSYGDPSWVPAETGEYTLTLLGNPQTPSLSLSPGAIWGCEIQFNVKITERRMLIIEESEVFRDQSSPTKTASRVIYADALQFGIGGS